MLTWEQFCTLVGELFHIVPGECYGNFVSPVAWEPVCILVVELGNIVGWEHFHKLDGELYCNPVLEHRCTADVVLVGEPRTYEVIVL